MSFLALKCTSVFVCGTCKLWSCLSSRSRRGRINLGLLRSLDKAGGGGVHASPLRVQGQLLSWLPPEPFWPVYIFVDPVDSVVARSQLCLFLFRACLQGHGSERKPLNRGGCSPARLLVPVLHGRSSSFVVHCGAPTHAVATFSCTSGHSFGASCSAQCPCPYIGTLEAECGADGLWKYEGDCTSGASLCRRLVCFGSSVTCMKGRGSHDATPGMHLRRQGAKGLVWGLPKRLPVAERQGPAVANGWWGAEGC